MLLDEQNTCIQDRYVARIKNGFFSNDNYGKVHSSLMG